ncbi:transporter, partial [Thalassiosira pseudonana CCMP1335]
MRGGTIKSSSDATTTILKKQQTLNALHQTSFLIVISTSIVAFSPLPSLTRHLGSTVTAVTSPLTPQERAVKILSFLSAISAAIELFLSPLIGVWIDLKGRKRPSVLLYSLIAMANLGVVLYPSVGSICISRTVNVLIGGFLMIVANTVIADMFAKNDDQMGTVLGRQAASISLGFLSGSLLGGRLTELGERPAYGCAFLFSTLAALNASFRMVESVDLAKSALGSH